MQQVERQAYSILEFCLSFGIPQSTLYAAWQQGKGPESFRIGRRRLISRQAAQAWIEKNTVRGAA